MLSSGSGAGGGKGAMPLKCVYSTSLIIAVQLLICGEKGAEPRHVPG